ncbi:O-antigen ligase family protein [Brachybacterium vulturis]|uniref:O-antigen ligase family protein n=1 Tax=Brachybacterium vulturis TaxID=2017484 RepID=UPI003734F6B1
MALLLALLVLLGRPFYTNAEAAAGVQLVALSGLLLAGSPSGPRAGPMTAVRTVLAAATGALGVLLAARSQAASVLVVLMVVVVVLALRRGTAPARHAILAAGLGVIGAAMVVVVVLGGLPVWPRWLRAHGSLSGARHRLWGDALALWGEHPVLGGGPGSFLEFSATARSEPHLYAAHSSILQVGAEFGAVGALLFVGVLVTGTLTASRGEGARGVIGVAAWCALAVHSMIDHLYEFPLVCLLAGLVIGWAGSRRSHAPLRRDSA